MSITFPLQPDMPERPPQSTQALITEPGVSVNLLCVNMGFDIASIAQLMQYRRMEISTSRKQREAEWLRLHAIINARERDGDLRLPPEPKLCEEIGVSRARLRGLLKRAEDQGLIWRHVGKGTFVGARPIVRDDAVEKLAVSVDDLFDARMLIEPMLAAEAALHATTHDIATMEVILADMLSAPSFQEWRRLDARLHRQVALATHNSLLVLLYDTLRMPMRLGLEARIEEVFGTPMKPRSATNSEHGDLVKAIGSHRPDQAKQIMHDHILSVRNQLFGSR